MIIDWKPNKLSDIPIYIQIIGYFERMIKKGIWVYGEKFPSQRELANMLQVNRSTIVTVMDELKYNDKY